MERLVLSGAWQLRPVEAFAAEYPATAGWLEQDLPAHWQEHPALAGHSGKVVYRKTFAGPPGLELAPPVRRWLRLRGVFYRFRIRLNGVPVGESEGYFFPQEFEVTGLLQAHNELIIEVDSPTERSCLEKETITGVFAHWDALSSYAYNAGGLWLPVELVAHPAIHIERALVHLERFDAQAAAVALKVELQVEAPGPARWSVTFTPHNFEGEALGFAGEVELAEGRFGWQQVLQLEQ